MKEIIQFQQFLQALNRFEEAQHVDISYHTLLRDGVIQRFEFTFELAWKLLKSLCEKEGLETNSPREAIKNAYKLHYIDDIEGWLTLLSERNQSSHVYHEPSAERIYQGISGAFELFVKLKKQIDERREKEEFFL